MPPHKSGKIAVTLNRSPIGCSSRQKVIVRTLGLRHIRQTVTHNDSPQIRGMIQKITHLLDVKKL